MRHDHGDGQLALRTFNTSEVQHRSSHRGNRSLHKRSEHPVKEELIKHAANAQVTLPHMVVHTIRCDTEYGCSLMDISAEI